MTSFREKDVTCDVLRGLTGPLGNNNFQLMLKLGVLKNFVKIIRETTLAESFFDEAVELKPLSKNSITSVLLCIPRNFFFTASPDNCFCPSEKVSETFLNFLGTLCFCIK